MITCNLTFILEKIGSHGMRGENIIDSLITKKTPEDLDYINTRVLRDNNDYSRRNITNRNNNVIDDCRHKNKKVKRSGNFTNGTSNVNKNNDNEVIISEHKSSSKNNNNKSFTNNNNHNNDNSNRNNRNLEIDKQSIRNDNNYIVQLEHSSEKEEDGDNDDDDDEDESLSLINDSEQQIELNTNGVVNNMKNHDSNSKNGDAKSLWDDPDTIDKNNPLHDGLRLWNNAVADDVNKDEEEDEESHNVKNEQRKRRIKLKANNIVIFRHDKDWILGRLQKFFPTSKHWTVVDIVDKSNAHSCREAKRGCLQIGATS